MVDVESDDRESGGVAGIEIRIDLDEWGQLMGHLLASVEEDEHSPLGHVCLQISDGRRRWISTDLYRAVVYDVGPEDGHHQVLVPLRLLHAAPFVAGDSNSVTLRVSPDDPSTLTLDGPGGSSEVVSRRQPYPDVVAAMTEHRDAAVAVATVDVVSMQQMLQAACCAPLGEVDREDFVAPEMRVQVAPAALALAIDWGEFGPTRLSVPARADASVEVSVQASYLVDVLAVLDPGEVTVTVPGDAHTSLTFTQGQIAAMVMPLDQARPARERVRSLLAEQFGPDVLQQDADGDFQITSFGVPVFARIVEAEPVRLRLLAVVVDQVPGDDPGLVAELLSEINQVNRSLGFAKVLLVDSQVMVVGDLVADTVDPEEVGTLLEHIREVANGLGPAFGARFGGTALTPDEEVRWADRAGAVVRAELMPQVWVDLTGPEALDEWPFEDPVYVVTAHDPHGRHRSAEANREANGRLASTLAEANVGFARAVLTAAGGAFEEESFLVWQVPVADVRWLGREFEQEMIFVITETEVAVVSPYTDRRVSLPRQG